MVIHFDNESTSLLRFVAALKVPVHDESVGLVIHPFSVITSALRAGKAAIVAVITGMEDVLVYVPVQDVAVGSVMHPLSVVTSILRAGTVETIPGIEDDPLK